MSLELLILRAFDDDNDIDKALSLLTPEIAKTGMVDGIDLFSMVMAYAKKNKKRGLSRYLRALREKGYRFNVHSVNSANGYVRYVGSKYTRYMQFISGFERSDILAMLFVKLTRTKLEPFFAMHTMPKMEEFLEFYPKEEAEKHFKSYLAMQTAREKVRKTAIVLIGVADRNTKAVLRIIARVVWSERGDEEWLE